MKLRYFLFFCFVMYFTPNLIAQVKKNTKAKKNVLKNKSEFPVFKTEEEARKWIYEDSLSRSVTDSIQYIKDSIESEKEWDRFYQKYYRPKDSLSYVDEIVNAFIRNDTIQNADTAAILISKKFKTTLQKARAIFYWIAATVKYDHYAFNNSLVQPIMDKELDAQYTFTNKKGVCQNYANLFQYMCQKVGVECLYLIGVGKNFPYCIRPTESSNHAWNCIKTAKGWKLLDVTWAAADTGYVDSYWFSTPPEEFVYSHLPLDSTKQFLRRTFSKKEFLAQPIISDNFFKSKIDFEIPEDGSFKLTGKEFSISMPMFVKNYSISYTLLPYAGDEWKTYEFGSLKYPKVETRIIKNVKEKTNDYTVEIPNKGTWWVMVDFTKKVFDKEWKEVQYPRAIIFKITY